MKRGNNKGIIIGITAAAAAVLTIMIAGLVFVFPIVKEKCTDFFVDQKLEQGYKYLSQQDYKPAIAAFNTVVKVDDKRTERYVAYQNELNRKMRSTIQLYESHLDQAIYAKDVAVPFKKLLDHIDEIDEVVEQNGSFDNDSYDLYLNEQLGTVKWDTIEW